MYRNYVVVKYTNRPLEFYEAKTGLFLREMVTNPPSFSTIDWTPHHGRHKTPKVSTFLISRQFFLAVCVCVSESISLFHQVDPLALGKSSSAVDFDLAMGASDGRASHVRLLCVAVGGSRELCVAV